MTVYFTSDTHFGHANIIKYCNRPYATVHEMDMKLIANWNERIGNDDIVYHVGDFSMNKKDRRRVLPLLHGKKHLIKGNHDGGVRLDEGWESVQDYKEVSINGQHIVLFHYAMRVWNRSHRGSWHLYGHSHGTLPDDPKSLSFDIGVDSNGLKPLSFDEVKAIMDTKEWEDPFKK